MIPFRMNGGVVNYPHIIKFDKTFIVPLTRGDGFDITKLLELSTNFVVIDRLTGSRISQRYDQRALWEFSLGKYKTHDSIRGGHFT